uniref:Homeobox domain-containing protein n=1 Tax=Aquila chrysaetos chrysaetos TaxID=223781 RepID=A0A663DVP7_AQUCH
MRDPTAEKGAGKTALLSAPAGSLNARLRGRACPCPSLGGGGGRFALQGGLPGPADTLEPAAVDICQTCELSSTLSAGGERTPAAAAAAGGTRGRQRRARTAFTSEQVCRLEKTFQRQKYLGASERRKLAAALQLSEIQIKTWFQNRRMKLKRQIQDHQHSLVSPAPLYSYPAGTPPALFQDGLHYPFAPQHQRLLPFTPVPAVQFSFSFPRHDVLQSTYSFMANERPYYQQHFLPHPSIHPVIQNKMDKQCHPVYAL